MIFDKLYRTDKKTSSKLLVAIPDQNAPYEHRSHNLFTTRINENIFMLENYFRYIMYVAA